MKLPSLKIPDCQDCGACCAYEPLWIEVTSVEAQKIDSSMRVLGDIEAYAMKTGSDHRCVALKGRIGKKVECSIYKDRPAACRNFSRGSDHCIYLRGVHRLGKIW